MQILVRYQSMPVIIMQLCIYNNSLYDIYVYAYVCIYIYTYIYIYIYTHAAEEGRAAYLRDAIGAPGRPPRSVCYVIVCYSIV